MNKEEIVTRIREAVETIDKAHRIVFGLFRTVPGIVVPLADSADSLYKAQFLLENLLDDADFVFDTEEAHDEH